MVKAAGGLRQSGMWRYSRALSFPLISFDQEVQQQLIIETRDLKKTRNFYQKLIHQERRSKGRITGRRRCRRAAPARVDNTVHVS